MFRRTQILSLTTAVISSAAMAQGPRPPAAEIGRAVDSLARRIVELGVAPGIGVALVMDGKTILARSYGMLDAARKVPAGDDALWYIASTSKSFTGFAVSLLSDQGTLRLDAPISALLPDVRWAEGVEPSKLPLTRFLSHTSYIADNAVVQSAAFTGAIPESRWPELIRFERPSGNTDLVYTNFGYNVAAMVIDRVRPEGWRRYLDSAVFRPAGLRSVYARLSGLDANRIAKPHALDPAGGFRTVRFEKTDATMNSAGGHVATMHDLARWTIVQMDSGRIDGRQVFPAPAVALSHRLIAKQTVSASMRFGPFDREGWAAGWDIGGYQGTPMISRFGAYHAFRSHLSFLPGRRIGFVSVVNGGAGNATDILASLAFDLEAGRPEARANAAQRIETLAAGIPAARIRLAQSDSARQSRQRATKQPLQLFAGTYANEALGAISFNMQNGALRFSWGVLEGPVEVFDADKDALRIEIAGSGTIVTFSFAASGPAVSLKAGGTEFTRRP